MRNKKVVIPIIGMGFIVAGAYFILIRAGIPYQDATYELQQRWNDAYSTGKVLILVGISILLISYVIKLINKHINNGSKGKNDK